MFVRLNSIAFKPASQYTELGFTMKFLCSFSGNVEFLHVTRVVLYTACRLEKGVESVKAGSDETTRANDWFSRCCKKKGGKFHLLHLVYVKYSNRTILAN
jgi:hypothetical protein